MSACSRRASRDTSSGREEEEEVGLVRWGGGGGGRVEEDGMIESDSSLTLDPKLWPGGRTQPGS